MNYHSMDQNLPFPPGKFGFPLVGETLNFLKDQDFALKRYQKYGPIFKTNILGKPTAVMIGSEANKFILQSHFEHFSWAKGWPATFQELLGKSLFLQDGEEHKKNRKLLMPSFHGQALINYFDIMESIIKSYLNKWETQENFTWFSELKQMTFEIASVLLLGSERGDKIDYLSSLFTDLSNGLFTIPLKIPGTKYSKAVRGRDLLLQHLEQEIIKRKENPSNDTLSLLVQTKDEDGNSLSINEIKVQALLMLFAGHETTTSMLTSLCLVLAQHPDILDQAKKEQEKIHNTDILTLEQIKNMTYLDQVLKEVERLYPPVAGGFRGVVKPFTFNGYYVPAGWQILYSIQLTHQNSEIFTNPKTFDPQRFNKEREEHRKTEYSLVGFGGGSRFCLGYAFAQMEMKIFAALLIRQYHWHLEEGQDLSLNRIPTLHPNSGLKIKNFQRLTK